MIGEMPARMLFSPGHMLASITYLAGDAAFTHDTIFMTGSGTRGFPRRQRHAVVAVDPGNPGPAGHDTPVHRP
jgi:glyoxylase-like metal-dependent hydrolase (beta-lactamase superfamily II)